MIHFKEYSAEYKEKVEVFIEFELSSDPKPDKIYLNWDYKESDREVIKQAKEQEGQLLAIFPIKFSLLEIDRPFFLTVKSEDAQVLCNSLQCELQDFFQEGDSMEIEKEIFKGKIMMRISLRLASNTFPYYSLTLFGKDLPLLSGLFGECDPFFRILKRDKDTKKYECVYESEVYKNNKNPEFQNMVITGERLCGSNTNYIFLPN